MRLSNCDISLPKSNPGPPPEPSVRGAVEEILKNELLQLHEPQKLKLSICVTEPLVVVMDGSLFGGSSSDKSLMVLLPKKGSHSLRECILVTLTNWERSGLPSYWTYTKSMPMRPIGLGGSVSLSRATLSYRSAHHLGWFAASRYVDQRYKSLLSRAQRRTRIDFWMSHGWGGTEELQPVQLSLWKTQFQLLRSLVNFKSAAYTGHT